MRRLFVLILCVFIPCTALADLTVSFLDVGQGDCAIIECDGEAMIIDGGLPGQSSKIYSFITNTKVFHFNRFEYMVATHPDNDHIGGLPAVFEACKNLNKKVYHIYSPVDKDESPRFTDLLNKAKDNQLRIQIPYNNEQNLYLGNARVVFYNSQRQKKSIGRSVIDIIKTQFRRDDPEEKKENNDISLVVKIIYGDTVFLFTGDIEQDAERRLISAGYDLNADVLKVAHHGSSNSSSDDFLEKVNPKYAVISCGTGNSYGHPNQETLNKLRTMGTQLYRTDLQGTITCHSDGHTITFSTEDTAKSDIFSAPIKRNDK